MPSTLTWSALDTNKGTNGYLDSLEVKNARKMGVDNVFVGMIQEDYEGTLDVDKIIDKYNKGSYGRMPMSIPPQECEQIAKLYREYIVLKFKCENFQEQMKQKYSLVDNFKNFLSNIGIIKKNEEYNSDKSKLEDLRLQAYEKERELADYIDSKLYKSVYPSKKNSEQTLYISIKSSNSYYN